MLWGSLRFLSSPISGPPGLIRALSRPGLFNKRFAQLQAQNVLLPSALNLGKDHEVAWGPLACGPLRVFGQVSIG